MRFLTLTKTGEKVYFPSNCKSYIRKEHLIQALIMVSLIPSDQKEVFVKKRLERFKGAPTTVPIQKTSKPFRAQRRSGAGVFPFLFSEETSSLVSVILDKHHSEEGAYVIRYAGWGDFYPISPEDPFWEKNAFNAKVIKIDVPVVTSNV